MTQKYIYKLPYTKWWPFWYPIEVLIEENMECILLEVYTGADNNSASKIICVCIMV